MEVNSINAMTARDYLRVIFRHKTTILVTFFTVMVVVVLGLMFNTPSYTATVTMMVSADKMVESPYYRDLGASNLSPALAQTTIVTSDPVINLAVKALGLWQKPLDYETKFCTPLKSAYVRLMAKMTKAQADRLPKEQQQAFAFRMASEELKSNIDVAPVRDTNLFTITVTDFDAVGAAIIANTVSRAYVIFDLEQQAAELQLKYGEKHPTVLQLKDNIEKMAKNLTGTPLPDIDAIGPASVKVIEQANVPLKPTGPSRKVIALLALVMAAFLSIMLAFIFEYADNTFKGPRDIEDFLNVAYLGFVPKKAQLADYYDLADQIYLLMHDQNAKSVMFSGAVEHEGVSATLANLASYFSHAGAHKVLVIDTNLRKPSLHTAFKMTQADGLTEIIEGKLTLEKGVKKLSDNLHFISTGKVSLNPATLLNSHAMRELLKNAKERYDIILLDSPAAIISRDAFILGQQVDAVVISVNEGKTRRPVVKAVLDAFTRSKVNVMGVVLNNRTFPIPEGLYHKV